MFWKPLQYDGSTWGGFHLTIEAAKATLRKAMGLAKHAKLPLRKKALVYQRKVVKRFNKKDGGRKATAVLPKSLIFRLQCVWAYAKKRQQAKRLPLAGPGDLLASIAHCKKSAAMYKKDSLLRFLNYDEWNAASVLAAIIQFRYDLKT